MKLNAIFADHMVLQADAPIRIFGSGQGRVSAALLGQQAALESREDSWCLTLPPQPAGGPYELAVCLNGEEKRFSDVWLGDVLLCAGQSNMQFTLDEEATPPEDYASDDGLRLFALDRPENRPHKLEKRILGTSDGWRPCRAEEAELWPALGYLTGRLWREQTGRAVGIVLCAQGASVIQSWMPPEVIPEKARAIPKEALFIDHTHPDFAAWNKPGFLYSYMFEKLLPYSFGQVIWYQGESNASPAEGACYLEMLTAMISCWRKALETPALPFVVVQIADTRCDPGWLAVQAAQLKAPAAIPAVKTVISADVCEKEMIHPTTKSLLAGRLCRACIASF